MTSESANKEESAIKELKKTITGEIGLKFVKRRQEKKGIMIFHSVKVDII